MTTKKKRNGEKNIWPVLLLFLVCMVFVGIIVAGILVFAVLVQAFADTFEQQPSR